MTSPKKNQSENAETTTTRSFDDWIALESNLDLVRLVICGSTSCGKSTIIDRLAWEAARALRNEPIVLHPQSKRPRTDRKNINLEPYLDRSSVEQQHGDTIHTLSNCFSTSLRKFIAIDPQGSEKHTAKLISRASKADVAILVIDAQEGLTKQARYHAYLLSLLGVKNLVVAVNKMDLVGFDDARFYAITTDFSSTEKFLAFQSITHIPVSATEGDNIHARSRNTLWFQGPTLLSHLETVESQPTTGSKFAFPVQWVNQPNPSFHGASGTLSSGQVAIGDSLRITASGQTAKLAEIIMAGGNKKTAKAGDPVTLVFDRAAHVSRGDVITLTDQPLDMTDQCEATLVWLHDDPGLIGRTYEIKLATQSSKASITNLKYRVDTATLRHEACKHLARDDIAVANLAFSKSLVFGPYSECNALGRFILIDRFTHDTVALGVIRHNLRRAQNVHRQALSIGREDREHLNGHKGKVIWFTGLSGSGKSTIANALEIELHAQGKRTYILDGDNVRQGLNKDLGFTDADRVENIRRIAEVAKLMMDAGLIVLTAFISPFRAEREIARELIGASNFIEVFVDTPLEVCEQRDPKGLYRKARSGLIPNMTGINSPYEPPEQPNFRINSSVLSTEEAVIQINRYLGAESK